MDDPTHLRWLRQRDQAWFNGDILAKAVIAYLNGEGDHTDLRVALRKYSDNDGPCLNIPKEGKNEHPTTS